MAALLAAQRAIQHEGRQAVAIVAGDTVGSAPLSEFLARADGSCSRGSGGLGQPAVPSPVIPNLYDRVARWHMEQYGTTREQLVSVCLQERQGGQHTHGGHTAEASEPGVLGCCSCSHSSCFAAHLSFVPCRMTGHVCQPHDLPSQLPPGGDAQAAALAAGDARALVWWLGWGSSRVAVLG